MSIQASANRYAKALLDVVVKEGDPVQAGRDLAAFADLFDQNPELRRVLTNPAVPAQGKRGVLAEIVGRSGPAPAVGKLLLLLAERDRLELLPALAAAYRERLMEHQGVVRAEVVTAFPVADERTAELRRRMSEVTGRTVEMTARVDPALIGGVVARIGSTVYDASVATHLARMRERLVENA